MKLTRIAALAITLITAAYTSSATAGVNGTSHDLETGAEGLCIYCHTPHGAASGAPAPLWNRLLDTDADFNTYDSTFRPATMTGVVDLDVTGISLACLSCHDGTQGTDAIINSKSGAAGVYNYDNAPSTANVMTNGAGDLVPMLGTDLTNDHPVGVEYGGGGVDLDCTANVPTDAAIFAADCSGTIAVVPTIGLPLYGAAAAGSNALIECATCHDVHNDTNGQFLRVSNASSAICLACHNK